MPIPAYPNKKFKYHLVKGDVDFSQNRSFKLLIYTNTPSGFLSQLHSFESISDLPQSGEMPNGAGGVYQTGGIPLPNDHFVSYDDSHDIVKVTINGFRLQISTESPPLEFTSQTVFIIYEVTTGYILTGFTRDNNVTFNVGDFFVFFGITINFR